MNDITLELIDEINHKLSSLKIEFIFNDKNYKKFYQFNVSTIFKNSMSSRFSFDVTFERSVLESFINSKEVSTLGDLENHFFLSLNNKIENEQVIKIDCENEIQGFSFNLTSKCLVNKDDINDYFKNILIVY